MLHGSETWPVRKENVVALQRAEMRMVRWLCGVKLKDRLPSKELRERLWPFGVCSKGVGSNSIQCSGCQKWVHKKCSGINGSMSKVA